MGSAVMAEPNFILFKLGERNLKSQSLEGSNIPLHDTFGIYGVEEIGTQVAEVLLLFYDVINSQNHGMCHSHQGAVSASSGSYLAVFCIIVTVLMANGRSRAFHQRRLELLVTLSQSSTFLLTGTFVTFRNQPRPRSEGISTTKLGHYDTRLGNNAFSAPTPNARYLVQQLYFCGGEFCFFLISSSNRSTSMSKNLM